jgi:hypothetical protein
MAKSETPTSEPLSFFARGRFLRLDKPKPFEEGADPRYEATFILDPSDKRGAEGIALVLSTAAKMSKETYGVVPLRIKQLAAKFVPGAPQVDLNNPANKDDEIKIAFLDGDSEKFADYSGYKGMFVIPAHNSRLKPAVANRKGATVLPGEDQWPYDGANVIGRISVWLQVGKTQAKYGKRVGVNLRGVQFHSDNQAFTADNIAAEDEFEALEDETPSTTSASDFD